MKITNIPKAIVHGLVVDGKRTQRPSEVAMHRLNVFELAKHEGPYELWPQTTELIKDGVPTGKKIPGYIIEAQYAHTNGFVLVTSWDCPI